MNRIKLNPYWIILFLLLSNYSHSGEKLIISLRSPEIEGDTREDYNYALIKLALEKTLTEFGDYEIVKVPPMNTSRSIYSLANNIYPNLMVELTFQEVLTTQYHLIYTTVPVDLGIVGYRICFVSPKKYSQIESVEDLTSLKNFSIGQGLSWADTDILRYNGFNVVEISNYSSIFRMVASGRIDLFCRGANEVQDEYYLQSKEIDLLYDKKFVLYYILPRFYFLNSESLLAKERIDLGLKRAYQDGEMKALWNKYFHESVDFVNLKNRKLFELKNPYLAGISSNYLVYLLKPSDVGMAEK